MFEGRLELPETSASVAAACARAMGAAGEGGLSALAVSTARRRGASGVRAVPLFKIGNSTLVLQPKSTPAAMPWPRTTAGLVLELAGHTPSTPQPQGQPLFVAVRPSQPRRIPSMQPSAANQGAGFSS